MQASPSTKPRPRVSKKHLVEASKPLATPKREVFCQLVARLVPVKDAYEQCGYSGGDAARTQLRRAPDVDARIAWLLANRVESDTKRRHASEKKFEDARLRLVQELERVAYADVRDLVQWDRRPVLDQDGNVTGFADEVVATPSHKLSRAQAANVKEISTKAGAVRIATHDKLVALDKLARVLGMFQDAAPPPSSLTVNQVNVGDVGALELARRLAFILASAGSQQPEPVTIEGKPEPEAPPKG